MWWRAWKARKTAAKDYRNLLAATVEGKTDLVRARKRLVELARAARLPHLTRSQLLADMANELLNRLLSDPLPKERESKSWQPLSVSELTTIFSAITPAPWGFRHANNCGTGECRQAGGCPRSWSYAERWRSSLPTGARELDEGSAA